MEGSEHEHEHEHEYEYEYSRKKKNKNRNKRRFSDEQIRSLETMFENETRVEPRKKVEVARELGLQPRQVAIWFQNKRARYKSKQLEQEYGVLRANYNNLASRFENLKSEKQALLVQLQKLNELMHKSEGEGRSLERENNVEGESDDNKVEFDVKPSLSIEQGSGTKGDYFGVEEEQKSLVELVEAADSSLTSAEDWGNFDSDDIFNQSTTGYQWWDFWS